MAESTNERERVSFLFDASSARELTPAQPGRSRYEFVDRLRMVIPQQCFAVGTQAFAELGGARTRILAAQGRRRSNQTEGTAGLELLADAALKLVQQLRPIISAKLKNQPALLAAWQLASRVEARGTGKAPVTPPAPEPPGSGS